MADGRIFISYRRGPDSDAAARLYDQLCRHFPEDQLVFDIDAIPLGHDFHTYLEKEVAECSAMLIVIGPGWVDAGERLSHENDWVRIEISTALDRAKIPVIPVFVNDAKMPTASELPPSLELLPRRNGIAIPHAHFNAVVAGRLSGQLREVLGDALATEQSEPPIDEGPARQSSANVDEHSTDVSDQEPVERDVEEPQAKPQPRPETEGEADDEYLIRSRPTDPMHLDPVPQAKPVRAKIASWVGAIIGVIFGLGLLYDQFGEDLFGPFGPKTPTGPMVLTTKGSAARTPLSELKPGDSFWDCWDCPEMVVIPEGEFMMGSPPDEEHRQEDEGPQHQVEMTAFALAETEVTFDQWQACADDGGCTSNKAPSDQGWGRGSRPVISVSWNDAQKYIDWLNSKLDGEPYRLPSEAEWEYSARAGTSTAYSTGDTITTEQANFDRDFEGGKTSPVSTFGANPWGLYDMHGNVWEWTADDWVPDYKTPRSQLPFLLSPRGDYRAVRGGSWYDPPEDLVSAGRGWVEPGVGDDGIGFRPARALATP